MTPALSPSPAAGISAPLSLGLAGLVALALLPPEASFLAGLAGALWLGLTIAAARRRLLERGQAG
ncbi:hypothetical protein JYK14_09130 [Siccirubricoccus sp. KC 17139]|uniref:Uncharacterized protein n=1 Tax=Siccirubricoccus soli TaxID=2899147 RepID=A0ABT1D337_9PROT|nr:hypothetical protein [Siccirubricoccus soli]MCO6416328.1 hypothetical protein [Siccirubricoccus soli]MCP2682462.1 hypothetical protein [Siccirubricoccus soli]